MLLSTAQGAEYVNEPHVVAHLMQLLVDGRVEVDSAKDLLDTYFFWAELVPSLTGRGINTNRHDQTFAGNWLGDKEVESRLAHSWRYDDIKGRLDQAKLVVKFVDQMHSLTQYASLWTAMPIIAILRNPIAVASSVRARGYFREPSTEPNHQPMRYENRGANIPTFVPEDLLPIWMDGTWEDRLYIPSLAYLRALSQASNLLLIRYDRVSKSDLFPLFSSLGLDPGPRTEEMLRTFRPEKPLPADTVNLPPRTTVFEEAMDLWRQWSRRADDEVNA